ncbi:hypothetical protein ACQY1Q_11330 [Tenacibaculum sp. TC6]|uniref:hypothetical protein n=1 Tax=Tenacibaculum sp. TC6 TaxID=3423223 RepID=UPI003D363AB9
MNKSYIPKKAENNHNTVSASNYVSQQKEKQLNTFSFIDNRLHLKQNIQGKPNNSCNPAQLKAHAGSYSNNQVAQRQSSDKPIQLLLTADTFSEQIETAGGVTDNIFFKAIRSGLLKFQKAGQPKSVKGRFIHNLYESITGPTQSTSTDKLKALDAIEHSAYAFLKTNVGRNTPVATNLQGVIGNLLEEVQQEHQEVISTEVGRGRVPYFRGQETLSKQQLAETQQDWQSILAGQRSIVIHNATAEDKNVQPEGFSNEILSMLHRTLGSNGGRELVHAINNDPHAVNILPKHPDSIAMMGGGGTVGETQALATGTLAAPVAGPQRGSILRVEPNMSDTQYPSQDANGYAIPSPAWLLFAHELIHTRHNQLGMNYRNLDKANYSGGMPNAIWSNAEEHTTIDLGVPRVNITENSLRAEHGLSERYGHR